MVPDVIGLPRPVGIERLSVDQIGRVADGTAMIRAIVGDLDVLPDLGELQDIPGRELQVLQQRNLRTDIVDHVDVQVACRRLSVLVRRGDGDLIRTDGGRLILGLLLRGALHLDILAQKVLRPNVGEDLLDGQRVVDVDVDLGRLAVLQRRGIPLVKVAEGSPSMIREDIALATLELVVADQLELNLQGTTINVLIGF